MTVSPTPAFEVFAPLRAGDFFFDTDEFSDINARITENVHGIYASIEAEALPVPEDATVASETTALLGALSFRDVYYSGMGPRLSAGLTSKFDIRFANEQERDGVSDSDNLKPVITLETSIELLSPKRLNSQAATAALALSHASAFATHKPRTEEAMISDHPSLMGIDGEPLSSTLRCIRGFSYDAGRLAAIKAKLGEVFAEDDRLQLGIKTHISPSNLFLLNAIGPILEVDLQGAGNRNHMAPPTLAQTIAGLRVARTLIERSRAQNIGPTSDAV